MRIHWTDEMLRVSLLHYAERFQRMPTANELRALGQNALLSAIDREMERRRAMRRAA